MTIFKKNGTFPQSSAKFGSTFFQKSLFRGQCWGKCMLKSLFKVYFFLKVKSRRVFRKFLVTVPYIVIFECPILNKEINHVYLPFIKKGKKSTILILLLLLLSLSWGTKKGIVTVKIEYWYSICNTLQQKVPQYGPCYKLLVWYE